MMSLATEQHKHSLSALFNEAIITTVSRTYIAAYSSQYTGLERDQKIIRSLGNGDHRASAARVKSGVTRATD